MEKAGRPRRDDTNLTGDEKDPERSHDKARAGADGPGVAAGER